MRRLWCLMLLCGCGTTRLVVPMLAENNSGQTGTATLEDTAKGLSVEVAVKAIGEPDGQVVHFHNGQCGEISAKRLVFPPPDGTRSIALVPLSAKGDGTTVSSNVLTGVKVSDFDDGNWVLNVHDYSDISLYTACGNIR